MPPGHRRERPTRERCTCARPSHAGPTSAPRRHPLRHPALELLARYRAVLGAAWAARQELAGPSRLADEAAFLPAALSLQVTPVHPAPRRALWAIMALFSLALAWAWFGQLDIVAVAPGRIVVSDRSKVIQPLEPAVVRAIRVKDGDRVTMGQVLIELDPTAASADATSVAAQLRAAEADAARSRALLVALGAAGPSAAAPSAVAPSAVAPSAVVAPPAGAPLLAGADPSNAELLRAEWDDIRAKQAKLAAEVARREAEQATVGEQLAKLQVTVPLARQREADFSALASQGFVSGHAGQDRTRERIEQERDLSTVQARLAETQATLAEARQAGAAYLAETRRTLKDREAQARLRAAQLRQEGAKTAQREQLTKLLSPIDGVVQQLAVHTPGGVVTAAQALMVVVPEGGALSAEVMLENKDIGFVHEGQAAAIKIDTFGFTRYGTIPARVTRVSADAIADDKRGLVFAATLTLQRDSMQVDGRSIRLSPGASLTAEIATGRRRLIAYLLDPIRRVSDESLRER